MGQLPVEGHLDWDDVPDLERALGLAPNADLAQCSQPCGQKQLNKIEENGRDEDKREEGKEKTSRQEAAKE